MLLLMLLLTLSAVPLAAQPKGFGGRGEPPAIPDPPVSDPAPDTPSDDDATPGPNAAPPAGPVVCADGPALTKAQVQNLLMAVGNTLGAPTVAATVVDRAGNPLGVFRRPGTFPGDEELALGLARTAAFFSNNQAPLTSRTVRFVSGIHFPPGIPNTPSAALYGIENTNRGCDLHVTWNAGKELPPATSLAGGTCDPFDTSGCGTGPVTGKHQPFDDDPGAVNPGGVPIFFGPTLVGGLGIAGVGPRAAEGGAVAAISAVDLSPVPIPLAAPGVVFIDGIRLPAVKFLEPPADAAPNGPFVGTVSVGPFHGDCAPDGYLVGPTAGSDLTLGEVERIVEQARETASRTRAVIRLPFGSRARMVIAVADLDGTILALFRMPDATVFSVDVAVAKARNVIYFSDSGSGGHLDLPGMPAGTAVTNRTISFGAQPLFPPGIDALDEPAEQGPFFDLFLHDLANPCSQGNEVARANQNGVVFFPGAIPLYRGGQLVGGLGISGDGVEQDDYVSFFGAEGFQPPEDIWADRVKIDGVRMPFLKFPRNPEK